ncbi:hypothetical protein [Celeribacter naphthalenivorans]|uniref:hypothetical protein n=1 Tax=Celeribacter naphthalenivorans TaxID=1614694 RepID=UPI001CF9EAAC|nr:hypothetical protein [Celeribacter naphthalenivorans]
MRAKTATFSSPRRGWISNTRILDAPSDAAEVLDNCIPTAQGARVRGGSKLHATVGDAVVSTFVHASGGVETMFAATADAIYDVTSPADPEVAPTADVTGLATGDWSSQHFSTAGGDFITIVNGADDARQFDGASWTTPSITGVASSDLSHVWSFKNRLWFIEENTTSAWYLSANAITGAATEFPLRGIFNLGGSLLFGATWSIDAGDGIDDVIVFVSTLGEIAVYTGTDPSSDFALSGVYRIGKPLGKNAHFRAGGDLAIATEDGIISVAEALKKDRAALQASSLAFAIEDEWNAAIANRTSTNQISVTMWPSQTLLMVGTPNLVGGKNVVFVANSRTGAWSRITGWDVRCATIFNDRFFFGTADGKVVEAETGGNDLGMEYSALWVPKFQDGNARQKFGKMARFRGRASDIYEIGLSCFGDFEVGSINVASTTAEDLSSAWGTGLWGTMTWGGSGYKSHVSEWQFVSGNGASIAPAFKVTVNRNNEPDLELIALDLMLEEGRVV